MVEQTSARPRAASRRSAAPSRWLAAVAAVLALAACGGAGSGAPGATSSADVGRGQLQGAGATFPEPFYARAFYEYSQLHGQVSVNYQAIGSGGGIQQFTRGTVDFGASDVPMTAQEVQAAGGEASLVELPATVGVESVAYNLAGVSRLQLDGPTLAGIYLGTIKRWNDPAIAARNGGVSLPGQDITVVHRSDGSGTTYAFTDYLSKISPDWSARVGRGKSVQWPAGVGASGNQGVGQQVKTTPGAIGYVELAYVVQSGLQMAFLKNAAGRYLQASLAGATAAAAAPGEVSPTSFSITDAAADQAYPIASYSWAILRREIADRARARALVNLWKWVVTDGQRYGRDLEYATLPGPARDYALAQLQTITTGGRPVLG